MSGAGAMADGLLQRRGRGIMDQDAELPLAQAADHRPAHRAGADEADLLSHRRPPYFFTRGQALSDSGRNASAAGIVCTTL